ncbi:hypothetical protein GX48_03605 [Paracoccidioides brasiliensis]|nr:hypothetical protein GX48_03605 [Paracoccidioides brasiliensis]
MSKALSAIGSLMLHAAAVSGLGIEDTNTFDSNYMESLESDTSTATITNILVQCINFQKRQKLHGLIMTLVFMIIYPLGALSLHLPLKLRVPLNFHLPIQIVGVIMMVAATALGIRLALEVHLWNLLRAHVALGALAIGAILIIQPTLGIIQSRCSELGVEDNKSNLCGVMHRWIGRGAILLGMANAGIGFLVVGIGTSIEQGSLTRSFVLMGVFTSLWFLVVLVDFHRGLGENGARRKR